MPQNEHHSLVTAQQQQSCASKPSATRCSPRWMRPIHGAKNSIKPDRKMMMPAPQNAGSYDPVTSDNQPTNRTEGCIFGTVTRRENYS